VPSPWNGIQPLQAKKFPAWREKIHENSVKIQKIQKKIAFFHALQVVDFPRLFQ
jgi:hypothetical protein